MVYPKTFLVSILSDAIFKYEILAGHLHPKRVDQISRIRRMCEFAKHDVMIISFLKDICVEINHDMGWGAWVFSQKSRLSCVIEECVSVYLDTVEFLRVTKMYMENRQSTFSNIQHPNTQCVLEPELPDIVHERTRLMALDM